VVGIRTSVELRGQNTGKIRLLQATHSVLILNEGCPRYSKRIRPYHREGASEKETLRRRQSTRSYHLKHFLGVNQERSWTAPGFPSTKSAPPPPRLPHDCSACSLLIFCCLHVLSTALKQVITRPRRRFMSSIRPLTDHIEANRNWAVTLTGKPRRRPATAR